MKKILFVLTVCIGIIFPAWETPVQSAAERPYFGIALIGDPHLPGRELPAKRNLLAAIDGWNDIDRVVVLGDICKETGTVAEYAAAKEFFQPP